VSKTTKKKTKSNKSFKPEKVQMVLRIDADLRDQFIEACQELDTSASREVRKYIKKFLKKYQAGDFDE
jgi:uncharacterized protein (DUF4415 family)